MMRKIIKWWAAASVGICFVGGCIDPRLSMKAFNAAMLLINLRIFVYERAKEIGQ